jgi:hypothetical protein
MVLKSLPMYMSLRSISLKQLFFTIPNIHYSYLQTQKNLKLKDQQKEQLKIIFLDGIKKKKNLNMDEWAQVLGVIAFALVILVIILVLVEYFNRNHSHDVIKISEAAVISSQNNVTTASTDLTISGHYNKTTGTGTLTIHGTVELVTGNSAYDMVIDIPTLLQNYNILTAVGVTHDPTNALTESCTLTKTGSTYVIDSPASTGTGTTITLDVTTTFA